MTSRTIDRTEGVENDAPVDAAARPRAADGYRDDAHAVIVGVDRYQDERIPRLAYACADAEALRRVLVDPALGGFRPANVTLLLNEAATERRVRSEIGTLLPRRVTHDDTVVIYFAGHGAPVIDHTTRAADGFEKYLVPYDADAADLRATAIPMEALQQFFGWISARQVIFFLDSCYSGGAGGRSVTPPGFQTRALFSDAYLDGLTGEPGRLVVTACAASEVSIETPRFGHGLFTHFLVQGLEGAADIDRDGRVTVDELYDYVATNVAREARLLGGMMRPVRKGSVSGRVYLTHVGPTHVGPTHVGATDVGAMDVGATDVGATDVGTRPPSPVSATAGALATSGAAVPQMQTTTRRTKRSWLRSRSVVLGAAAIAAILAVVLVRRPVPRTGIRLSARTSALSFVPERDAMLLDHSVVVDRLEAHGVDSVRLTDVGRTADGRRRDTTLAGPEVVLAARGLGDGRGELTLDTIPLRAGNRVRVRLTDSSGLNARVSLPPDAQVRGGARKAIAVETSDGGRLLTLGGAGRVTLFYGETPMDVTWWPRARPIDFPSQFGVTELALSHAATVLRDTPVAVRDSSALIAGRLVRDAVADTTPLLPPDVLDLAGLRGQLDSFRAGETELSFELSGTVDEMSLRLGERRRQLMPTVGAWMRVQHDVVTLWTVGIAVAGVAVAARRLWRRSA